MQENPDSEYNRAQDITNADEVISSEVTNAEIEKPLRRRKTTIKKLPDADVVTAENIAEDNSNGVQNPESVAGTSEVANAAETKKLDKKNLKKLKKMSDKIKEKEKKAKDKKKDKAKKAKKKKQDKAKREKAGKKRKEKKAKKKASAKKSKKKSKKK